MPFSNGWNNHVSHPFEMHQTVYNNSILMTRAHECCIHKVGDFESYYNKKESYCSKPQNNLKFEDTSKMSS